MRLLYSKGDNWVSWMRDYRFGTMVFLPTGSVGRVGDELRSKYDPGSAKGCAAHVTITQPFAIAPKPEHIAEVKALLGSMLCFSAQIGPATTSPNKRLIWFDVNPKDAVLNIRERLHETGLFRTDLPLTRGFIPHLTISEAQKEPEDVQFIVSQLNSTYTPWNIDFASVSWIVPNDDCVFAEKQVFFLQPRDLKPSWVTD